MGRWLSRRAVRVICMAAIIVGAACGFGWAQPTGADPAFEAMRAKLKVGDRVTVDVQNGPAMKGRFLDVGPDALSISTAGGERRLSRSEVTLVRRHRHGVLLGAIIGGGVGLAFGTAVGTYFANEGHDRDGPLFGLTALGLGLGIAIDAAANIPRTVYQRGPSRTALTIHADPRRPAVRVVVAF